MENCNNLNMCLDLLKMKHTGNIAEFEQTIHTYKSICTLALK